jgi:hypothetical protein
MSGTYYDWSPLFDAINNNVSRYSDQNRYNAMLDQMMGKQVMTPGSVGMPQLAAIPSQLNATAPQIPGAPAPRPVTANMNLGGQAATPGTPGGMGFDGPAGQALGASANTLLPMLRNAPPSMGFPLLLQSVMKNADRQQKIADSRITPISDDEAQQLGLRKGGVYGRDLSGNVVTIQPSDMKSEGAIQQVHGEEQFKNSLPMNAYQQATVKDAQAKLAEDSRHNRATEDTARNPFGMGVAGNVTGDDFYNQLAAKNAGLANQIKAIGSYRQAPPGRGTKQGIALMDLVSQYNPQYDATQYGAKNKARLDFTTGKNGNNVRSLNVAVQHLEQLGGLSAALGNGDIQMVNKLGQAIAEQTGSPAPTNFDGVKQMVGDEIVKAVVGSGGGVHDREEIANNISRASSPQQLMGVIRQYQGLLGGQLKGLKKQYEKSTGLNDFEDYLDPLTKSKLEGANSPAPGASETKVIDGVTYHKVNGQWMQ